MATAGWTFADKDAIASAMSIINGAMFDIQDAMLAIESGYDEFIYGEPVLLTTSSSRITGMISGGGMFEMRGSNLTGATPTITYLRYDDNYPVSTLTVTGSITATATTISGTLTRLQYASANLQIEMDVSVPVSGGGIASSFSLRRFHYVYTGGGHTISETYVGSLYFTNGQLSGTVSALALSVDGQEVSVTGLSQPVAALMAAEGADALLAIVLKGNDQIQARIDSQVLYGYTGADVLDSAGHAATTMLGGSGGDTYIVDDASDVVLEDGTALSTEVDLVRSAVSFDLSSNSGGHLLENVENLTLTGTGSIDGAGNALRNRLVGNAGNNLLDGGAGWDTLIGGAGNDVYVVDDALDTVTESLAANGGIDEVRASVGWTLGANIENLALTGSGSINGTGNALNNRLQGNTGNNLLNGGLGIDTFAGGAGDDVYVIDREAELLNVVENADEGADTLQVLYANASATVAKTIALSGNLGGVDHLTVIGTGLFNLTGNDLANTLTGNTSANVLDGGAGADTLVGGAGNDTYVVDDAGDVVSELAAGGVDKVLSSVTYALSANVEHLTLTGDADIDGVGNALGNILEGNAGANILTGGLGNDTYVVNSAGDLAVETSALVTEIDLVKSSVSYALGDYLENLTLTGAESISGTGNALNNTLLGNDGDNVLDGVGGGDTLKGGKGNDTYVVDLKTVGSGTTMTVALQDLVIENLSQGTDTLKLRGTASLSEAMSLSNATTTLTLAANLEHLDVSGAADVKLNLTGNGVANRLTGNNLANILNGGLGADTLAGGAGDDIYLVDNVGDSVVEAADEGADLIKIGMATANGTYILGDNIENGLLANLVAYNLTGNDLANMLTGNASANVLDGGAGADTLVGGAGNDTYVVDSAGDVVSELAAGGVDKVLSSVTYALSANVEHLTLTGDADIDGVGNALANILEGNAGANILTGGLGNDTYVVNSAGDLAIETSALVTEIDLVKSSVSYALGDYLENLTLTGAESISGTGNALNNTLLGNDGDNVLDGGGGVDTLKGGKGNDTYVVDLKTVGSGTTMTVALQDLVIESLSQGTDTLKLRGTASLSEAMSLSNVTTTLTLAANLEHLDASGAADLRLNLTGNGVANTLIGNNRANRIDGGAGNDTLDGGLGADSLIGGTGNDTYLVDNAGDVVSEISTLAGEIDRVVSSVSYVLGANVEQLVLSGDASINATGNGLNNLLVGNAGANLLDGGAGTDELQGGLGDDIYVVDLKSAGSGASMTVALQDVITESAEAGNDTLRLRGTYALTSATTLTVLANLENIDASAAIGTKLNLVGDAVANILIGNNLANVLSGAGGNDILNGGAGDDTIDGGDGAYDILRLSGSASDYVITYDSLTQHYTVAGIDGVDDVFNVEYVAFGDSAEALIDLHVTAPMPVPESFSAPGEAIAAMYSGWLWVPPPEGLLTLTYSFMSAVPTYYPDGDVVGFSALGELQQTAVRQALASYEGLLEIDFVEVASDGVLQFGANEQVGSAGYAYYPGDSNTDGTSIYGDVWLANNVSSYNEMAADEYGMVVIVHEIGHTLGLKHPGDYGGGEVGPFLPAAEDTTRYSIMSYNDRDDLWAVTFVDDGMGGLLPEYYAVESDAPGIYDVATLQLLYGANQGYASGDDVYTFVDSPFFDTIWDGGGSDTFDVSALSHASIVDLRAGSFSSIGYVADPHDLLPTNLDPWWLASLEPTYTGQNNVAVCYGVTIENAIGSDFNDRLIGNEAANLLDGGAGNDDLAAGAGNDTLTGGAGNDRFFFNTALGADGNLDRITDFVSSIDKFMLASDVFSGVSPGVLSAATFASGNGMTAASTADQRLIYNLTTGMLYWDADGSSAGSVAVAFAELSNKPQSLTASDFHIYAA